MKLIALMNIFLFVLVHNCSAQEAKIGDTIRNLKLNNVWNYSGSSLSLSQFRGKLIILDFWGFNCASCLKAMPKLDTLQKSFSNQLQIILVNRESQEETVEFFKKRKRLLRPSVPFITGDTILNKIFPHYGEPFHVWINRYGKILSLTEGYHATKDNVEKVLTGNIIDFTIAKRDTYLETFFDEKWLNLIQKASYISKCDPDVHLEVSDKVNDRVNLTYNCYPIPMLYATLFDSLTNSKFQFSHPGRTVVEFKGSEKVYPPQNEENFRQWLRENTFSYQLLLPKKMEKDKFEIMKNDLDSYFNLTASINSRNVNCLELVRLGSIDKLKTKGGKPKDTFVQRDFRSIDDSMRYFMNKPYNEFINKLRPYVELAYQGPFIDRTNYSGNIDFEIDGNVLDELTIESLNKVLINYNLLLVKKELPFPVLVISAKPHKQKSPVDYSINY